jgi:hypothetical protein
MSASQLLKAVEHRKAVTGFHSCNSKPIPAAVIVEMSFRIVAKVLPKLKIYRKQK